MNFDKQFADSAENLIRARRSKRAFLPTPVPQEILGKIFELANNSPSASNIQARHIEVVSGETRNHVSTALIDAARANRLSADFPIDQELYKGNYLERMQKFGAGMYGTLKIPFEDVAGRRDVYLSNLNFYGAPHAAFLYIPNFMTERQASDVGIYGQTLMLAMKGYGVDSCPQAILSLYADPIREVLDIKPEYKLLWGISFGYADPNAPINSFESIKAPVSETVRFWP